MAENKGTQSPKNRDGLALIVGGLFILGLVFATYTYFNRASNNPASSDSGIDKLKQIISSSTQRNAENVVVDVNKLNEKNAGSNTEDQNNTQKVDSNTNSNTQNNSMNSNNTALGTGGPITPTSNQTQWVANTYKQGDILKGKYTVKSGDTLWQIAVAVYGDGTQWTKLLQANSASIGKLPNGEQALIIPGQVLNIP
ncbi:MAG TPA: LysM peptidoglycan-binding domain-containing protein [Candidatus Saccharimonadales bacterium]|nr:LysM peptidoglycan-binding domain-containing protein [Candidatus Saccharimonadales bacterium]